MPTFDDPAGGAGSTAIALAMLASAALLAGLAVGLVVVAVFRSLQARSDPVAAVIGDAQRRLRRERARQESSLTGLGNSLTHALVPVARALPLDSLRASLKERYARAGWPGGLDDDEVMASGLVWGLVMAIPFILILLLLMPLSAPFGLFAILLGPALKSASLNSDGTKRELAIKRTMPFALDLLVLTMRAGASMLISLERVAIDYANNPVGVEFRSVITDMETGATMRQAFENLAQRAPVPVVKAFVEDVIQSEELGRPLADTLEVFSDRIRVQRVQDAIDTAGRAKVLVLIPGMLVLFATMLMLFGPWIVKAWYGGFTDV